MDGNNTAAIQSMKDLNNENCRSLKIYLPLEFACDCVFVCGVDCRWIHMGVDENVTFMEIHSLCYFIQ